LADHREPGAIFVGLREDGSCAGLTITEELERMAAAFRSDGSLLPMPSMLMRRERIRGCDVLLIEVEPASAPPVRLSGVAWVRVGSTNQKATAQEERRLAERVQWQSGSFDLRPASGGLLNDLDMSLFERSYLPQAVAPEVLEANDRPREQQLSALRLATAGGTPTYAGILVLGKDVRSWIPGAYVQFVRIDGADLADRILDQKEIDGPLPDLMRRLDEVLELNVRTPTEIAGHPTEVRTPDYPVEALRQLARNVVMHRTYEGTNAPILIYWFLDRIEIHSPGGPFGRVNRQNFGAPGLTDYRNPQVAEAMRVLDYVQRFGAGFSIVRRELEKNRNPPLEHEVEPAHVLVRLRRRA
jgi:ATP-dependent DNA helicase RecG